MRGDDHFAWCAGFDEIIENMVCDRFIKRVHIAIRCEIEFERFAFNAQPIGHVIDIDPCEIRLARYGTNRSEIVCLKMNTVISFRSRIGKRLEARFRW